MGSTELSVIWQLMHHSCTIQLTSPELDTQRPSMGATIAGAVPKSPADVLGAKVGVVIRRRALGPMQSISLQTASKVCLAEDHVTCRRTRGI